ncbi:hypothetical protein KSS87_005433 [Heliosperma pusillum]|nr:hypothetical protein KSS87_005433 [Heliosperma pusillum]
MAPTRGCPTYMLYCKRKGAGGDYCVTVRHGKLFLTLPNNNDPNQLWKKYESSEGGCALIHKATDKAVKYDGIGDQVAFVVLANFTCSLHQCLSFVYLL